MPTPDELSRFEEVAVHHIEKVARELVLPSFGGPLSEHHWRSHTQVHTVDDHLAGEALRDLFQGSFPDHGYVIEDTDPVEGDGVHCWYIDPIDGSANHLRGIPYVSITAGLMVDGVPVVGVVHDIVRKITLSAFKGGGARARENGALETVKVSGTDKLEDVMLIAHLSRYGPLVNIPDVLKRTLMNIRKIRCMGSIALDLSLLAAGEADLLVVGRGTPQRLLDILGGMVVLEEAGGAVMTADGGPVSDTTRTLVAGPPAVCRAFVELMDGYGLEAWTAAQARQAET